MLKLAYLIAIVSATIVSCHAIPPNTVDIKYSIPMLYDLIEHVNDGTDKITTFLKPSKADLLENYDQELARNKEKFKMLLNELLNHDSPKSPKSQKNSGFNWFGMINNSEKNLKNTPPQKLREFSLKEPLFVKNKVAQYIEQCQKGMRDKIDVIKEANNYEYEHLKRALAVLRADVENLVRAEHDVKNNAISDYLQERHYILKTDYYTAPKYTKRQMILVRNFLLDDNVKEGQTVGETVEKFEVLGDLTLGRLSESCNTLIDYYEKIVQSDRLKSDIPLENAYKFCKGFIGLDDQAQEEIDEESDVM